MRDGLRVLLLVFSVWLSPTLAECVDVRGELTQGTWLRFESSNISAVRFNEQRLPLIDARLSWVGLGRDSALDNTLRVTFTDGRMCEQPIVLREREYKVSVVEGVPQRTVTPPQEDLERIRREGVLVRAAKQQVYECDACIEQLLSATQMPLTGRISGVYGSQRIYNGKPGNPHYGLDIARPTGTPVSAPVMGLVVLAEPDLYYSGGTVIIHHGYGVTSSFLHMSQVSVRVGDMVAQGDKIGEVGATGRATGPHLDWRMNFRDNRVDPNTLFSLVPAP
ncbi:Peptidase M23B, secreted [Aequoribacter fuscus]|uniref:Peptidase M23B, secreted n=2 Tax=Aequoribacter TaxID=2847769 RepID=F3KZT6_9GAMM|nr:M23 family metallopeptidase [Aequoribacter fuscus]EGG30390.1 Peptidase M23B, secreted [Aequoribacter fuscus]QHJ88502.1 M23 family metallopeptidase [Aequoribacter fuscus]